MRRFGVTVGAAILVAASAIPAGAGSLYSNGSSETAQNLNLVPVAHRSSERHRDRDCHRYPARHFIPGYGRVLHDHDGPRCRVDVMRRADRRDHRDRDRGDCIRIGDIKICT